MEQASLKHSHAIEHDKIKASQAIFIHELALSSQIGGLLLSLLILVAYWGEISLSILLIWFSITNFVSILRFLHWFSAKEKIGDEAYMLSWLPRLQFLLCLSGLSWGLGTWFLYLPDDLFLNTLLFLFLMGIISGGIGALSPYLSSYIIYSISAGIPFLFKLLIEHQSISFVMPIALILFMIVNTLYARNIQNNILKIILLRFENDELVKKLTQKNSEAKQQTELADQANLSKSKFLAAASHDLAQPLHSLSLFLAALKNDNKPEQQQEYIQKASQCANTMNNLFNALMDISKLDAGVVESKMEVFKSNDLINPIAQEFEISIQDSELNLEVDIDNYFIETDGIIFQRIIRNLLSNAMKHNTHGLIGIRTRYENSMVYFDIFDTGQGIPKDELNNIFQEYIQLNNPERNQDKGLGLGLPIVKRLSSLINASISVESELNKGTTFSLAIKASEKPHSSASKVSETHIINNLENINLLFIDDDQLIRDGMQAMAAGWGCNIICAEDEIQAINLLIQQDIVPDIILSDYRLQNNKTGIHAIKRISDEFNTNFPSIIITGDTSPEITQLIQANEITVTYKPIDKQHLKDIISKLLNKNTHS